MRENAADHASPGIESPDCFGDRVTMATAITVHTETPEAFSWQATTPKAKSLTHRFALLCVWLSVATAFFVFSEPAPVDALVMGLFILLPAVGLFEAHRAIVVGFALWMVVAVFTIISCVMSRDMDTAAQHSFVSFYLYGACFLYAGFVCKNPEAHTRLILQAYFTATLAAAMLGIVGYFDLFPGAFDLLTRFGRATGTFKDPNVFGPFLIPGLLTALHLFLIRPVRRAALPLAAASLLTLAILLSFSRGAWAATSIALAIYCYVYLHSAERAADRLKLAGLAMTGTVILGLLLAVAWQSNGIATLLEERAALTQPYDEGPDGRFGGQAKAVGLILENPLGIGAQAFTIFYHHEEAHNVYLSVLMSAGWIGGLLYFFICAGTLALGLQHAFKRTKTQHYFVIAYAALAGTIIEGALIDTDHWRHFYLLMGIVWGLMAADRRAVRATRIVRDVTPVLRRAVLIVPPTSRSVRIVGRVNVQRCLPSSQSAGLRPPAARNNRIIGRHSSA